MNQQQQLALALRRQERRDRDDAIRRIVSLAEVRRGVRQAIRIGHDPDDVFTVVCTEIHLITQEQGRTS
jgi:superfamily II helicase